MKKKNTPNPVRLSLALLAVFSLCCSIVMSDVRVAVRRAEASSGNKPGRRPGDHKVSPELHGRKNSTNLIRVILQLNDKPSGKLNALLNRSGVHVRRTFNNLNAHTVELPESVVDDLPS